jgi:hypothetical protein
MSSMGTPLQRQSHDSSITKQTSDTIILTLKDDCFAVKILPFLKKGGVF